MLICFLGFCVRLLSIKANICDALTFSKILGKLKELREDSFSTKRFFNKYRTNPPDSFVLVVQKQSCNWLVINFFDNCVPVIGLDQILHSSCDKVFVKFSVFCL